MRKKLLIIGMLVATLHHSPTHGAASLWDTTTRQAQSWWTSITQTLTPYTNYLQENIRRYLYPATPVTTPSPVKKPTYPTVPQKVQQPKSTQKDLLARMNTAILNKDYKKVQELLEAGIDPNSVIKNGASLLEHALKTDQDELAVLLLEKGADPNGKTKKNVSMLEYAIWTKKDAITELLLAKGAQLTDHAFVLAVRVDNVPIVQLALDKGANPNYVTKEGDHILDWALNEKSDSLSARLLLEKGAQPTQKSLLLAIVKRAPTDIIAKLLDRGANPNATFSDKGPIGKATVLEYALHFINTDVAVLLINKGAKPPATTKNGTPLIQYAYDIRSMPLLETFVKHGASIDNQNKDGETILIQAVASKKPYWTEFAVKLGANPSIKDKRGLDAFDWAENNPVLTRILKKSTHTQPTQQEQEPKEQHNARLAQMYQALSDSGKLKKQKEISTPYELHHQASEKTTSEIYRNLFQEEILAKYGDAIEKHKINILRLIHREREYWKTHYVFYHAQEAIHRIAQDFWLEILSLLHLKNPQDFIPLRFPELQDTLQTSTVQDFLLKNKILPDCKKNDHDNNIAHNLLSVNIALFGNIENAGESSIYYYLNSISIKKLTTEQILNKMTAYYAFNAQLVKSLASIEQPISQNFGNLLQIFIPKNLAEKCVYLSKAYGCPYKEDLDVGGYNQEYTYQAQISPVIEAIQNGTLAKKFDKEKLKRILDSLQARIILAKDIVLNPESGVKIFREVSAPPKLLELYKQKMQTISRKIIIDWLGRIQNKTMPTEVLERVATTPLGAVLRDKQKTEKLLKELIDLDTSATIRPQQAPPQPPRARL